MDKDLFSRHCPVRPVGFEIKKRITDDVSFVLRYKRSDCADFYVALDFGDIGFTLFSLHMGFCFACGRFICFGTCFDLCWLCKDVMEDDEEEW